MELLITIWYQVPEWRLLRLKDCGQGKCIDPNVLKKSMWKSALKGVNKCLGACLGQKLDNLE
jgi:hypothetical protein